MLTHIQRMLTERVPGVEGHRSSNRETLKFNTD